MKLTALMLALLFLLPGCVTTTPTASSSVPQTLPDEFMGYWDSYSDPFDLVFLPGNVIKTVRHIKDGYLPDRMDYRVIHQATPHEFYLVMKSDFAMIEPYSGEPMIHYNYINLMVEPDPYNDDAEHKKMLFQILSPPLTEEEWEAHLPPETYWSMLQTAMPEGKPEYGNRQWYGQGKNTSAPPPF